MSFIIRGRRNSALHRLACIARLSTLACATIALGAAQVMAQSISILSSPAYAVTGEDALVQVSVPAGMALSDVVVRLNGRDVTGAFQAFDPTTLRGLVSGFSIGPNTLSMGSRSGAPVITKLLVTDRPRTGPVFSGPHQTPYVCETQFLGLGNALDANCTAPTRVDYFYRSSATNTFQPYNTSGPPPSDLATTTTAEGLVVPYIVRREMGTINRAVYVIAILHDPSGPLSTPVMRTSGYNGRLVYSFGGGCQAGYHQGRSGRRADRGKQQSRGRPGRLPGLFPRPGLRRDRRLAQRDGHHLRGRHLGRDRDDDQGAIHRGVRAAALHDRRRRVRRIDAAAPAGQQLSGPPRRDHAGPCVPGPDELPNPLFDCELLVNAINGSALVWTQGAEDRRVGRTGFWLLREQRRTLSELAR
jgi:hypothetical protein